MDSGETTAPRPYSHSQIKSISYIASYYLNNSTKYLPLVYIPRENFYQLLIVGSLQVEPKTEVHFDAEVFVPGEEGTLK